EAAVGPQGLVLMPSFNLTEGDRTATWKGIATTPATTGWLTEYFRRMSGTLRSDHYSHSVAARGPRAAEFVGGHLRREGARSIWDREPWGYTYGSASPFQKMYNANGKILMLGVDYHTATFIHLVETLHWNRRIVQEPAAPFRAPFTRKWLGAWWDSLGRLVFGKVGDANCRLFAIRDFVDTLLAAVDADPDRWDKWSPRYADHPGPESGFPGPL
ncbi:MAG: AAC(3) family N-acetyltransferase, partial [Lentisphaerae bacterium]|nr:AAC(3) family N-acetyltransferase [Lentisphaerota bacterium]